MAKKLLSLFAAFLSALAVPLPSFAIDARSFTGFDFNTGPSEYVIQEYPSQKLIAVHLLSGVSKPGLYRIPADTNLVSLLSYSGGISNTANPNEIMVKSNNATTAKQVSLRDIMATGQGPNLKDNDILYIPEKKPLISSDTVTVISLVTSVLAIISISVSLSKD